jgi:hypothetical protein
MLTHQDDSYSLLGPEALSLFGAREPAEVP